MDLLPFFNRGWVALPSSSSSGKRERKVKRKTKRSSFQVSDWHIKSQRDSDQDRILVKYHTHTCCLCHYNNSPSMMCNNLIKYKITVSTEKQVLVLYLCSLFIFCSLHFHPNLKAKGQISSDTWSGILCWNGQAFCVFPGSHTAVLTADQTQVALQQHANPPGIQVAAKDPNQIKEGSIWRADLERSLNFSELGQAFEQCQTMTGL